MFCAEFGRKLRGKVRIRVDNGYQPHAIWVARYGLEVQRRDAPTPYDGYTADLINGHSANLQ